LGFCLFVINDDYFNKLSDLNNKFLINKSKETTEFQRRLAISEDDILIKKIKSKNIKIENIDQGGLEDFKSATNNFHESYFQTYPHMKQYIKM
jgi:TRAP-type C4-dicarboxylate transport system substrate-binding protein